MIASEIKIFNDPVYGFIKIPKGIILKLVDHPYVQRLRRIKQLGLTDYVYPGASHSRFHHALGALHLMTIALDTLLSKGIIISTEEYTATQIAILLHDIGHGPFSHALEREIFDIDHEEMSEMFMAELNIQFHGALSLAISIFNNKYSRIFFHQLISGQLDVDRMDYLKRDSFFTGVAEGSIGHDRILSMLNVVDDELVVEEKAAYSIEKFLIARHMMYWQVYLHKTVISAEQMLVRYWARLRDIVKTESTISLPSTVKLILQSDYVENQRLDLFSQIDDIDVFFCIKKTVRHADEELSYLAQGLADRNLFKIQMRNDPFESDEIRSIRLRIVQSRNMCPSLLEKIVFTGKASVDIYGEDKGIKILTKDGSVEQLTSFLDISIQKSLITKYFLCHPSLNS